MFLSHLLGIFSTFHADVFHIQAAVTVASKCVLHWPCSAAGMGAAPQAALLHADQGLSLPPTTGTL